MILSETVKLRWNGKAIPYYTSKGYKYTKQGDEFDVKVKDLSHSSIAKILVKCDCCGKEKYLKYGVYYRYERNGVYLCNKCANLKKDIKKSFYDWCIENDKDYYLYWDYDKNNKSPKEINYGTQDSYYFKCRRNLHESESKKINRMLFEESYAIKCEKCNSFAQYGIDNYGEDFLNKYWDYDKNVINPFDLSFGSHEPIYLICQNRHGTYKTAPNYFSNYGDRCPQCKQEDNESFLQKKVRLYLEDLCEVDRVYHENQCTLYPINPKTGYKLPFDNDVLLKNRKHLIIEVNGGQHYSITGFHYQLAEKNGTTPEEEFAYQQWKDEYKKQYALSHGYEYLAIPYWTEKDESYKQLIDDKIAEINNKLKCKGDTL